MEEAWQAVRATKLKVPEETNLQEETTKAQELERPAARPRPGVPPSQSRALMRPKSWRWRMSLSLITKKELQKPRSCSRRC